MSSLFAHPDTPCTKCGNCMRQYACHIPRISRKITASNSLRWLLLVISCNVCLGMCTQLTGLDNRKKRTNKGEKINFFITFCLSCCSTVVVFAFWVGTTVIMCILDYWQQLSIYDRCFKFRKNFTWDAHPCPHTETEIESAKEPRSLRPSETQLICEWLSNSKRDFVWYVVAVGYAINKRKI